MISLCVSVCVCVCDTHVDWCLRVESDHPSSIPVSRFACILCVKTNMDCRSPCTSVLC
eukprot:m.464020 g.464020  ORF g.464020 m.464020 type:complete len:58 (-) comp21613_c0_seq12:815-988(-)